MLDKLLNNAVCSAEIEWISYYSFIFFLFCSWEQVQPFYIYRRRKFCKGSRQLIWCLCGTVGCANTGKMLLSRHLHDYTISFFFSLYLEANRKGAKQQKKHQYSVWKTGLDYTLLMIPHKQVKAVGTTETQLSSHITSNHRTLRN